MVTIKVDEMATDYPDVRKKIKQNNVRCRRDAHFQQPGSHLISKTVRRRSQKSAMLDILRCSLYGTTMPELSVAKRILFKVT